LLGQPFSLPERRAFITIALDCYKIAREVLVEFERAIDEKNASIACGDLPVLNTSPTLMRVLFRNLISNALKFQDGSKRPEIEIRSERQEKSWRVLRR